MVSSLWSRVVEEVCRKSNHLYSVDGVFWHTDTDPPASFMIAKKL